ncbi:MAG TPA: signal peptidase II [Xanthobacteraceae bacterium]|nr:signal peptidase II [Xanthobacteraceae bacterium]
MTEKPAGSLAAFGLAVAALTLVADQATKLFVLYGLRLGVNDVVAIAPFCDLVLAMNRGISYGLLPQDSEFGRWILVMVNLAAAGAFVLWLRRVRSRLLAAALGFLLGGALGNAIDRAAYGAVVDFISLHALGWRWYVFNVADAAIVAGVIGLLYDALVARATK